MADEFDEAAKLLINYFPFDSLESLASRIPNMMFLIAQRRAYIKGRTNHIKNHSKEIVETILTIIPKVN